MTIENVNYNLSDIKFKHVKELTTTLSTFKLYKNSDTKIDVTIKQTFNDSHSYSFYQIVDVIIKAISKDNTGLTLTQISQSVSSMLYSSLGFYYTEYIPKTGHGFRKGDYKNMRNTTNLELPIIEDNDSMSLIYTQGNTTNEKLDSLLRDILKFRRRWKHCKAVLTD